MRLRTYSLCVFAHSEIYSALELQRSKKRVHSTNALSRQRNQAPTRRPPIYFAGCIVTHIHPAFSRVISNLSSSNAERSLGALPKFAPRDISNITFAVRSLRYSHKPRKVLRIMTPRSRLTKLVVRSTIEGRTGQSPGRPSNLILLKGEYAYH